MYMLRIVNHIGDTNFFFFGKNIHVFVSRTPRSGNGVAYALATIGRDGVSSGVLIETVVF